MRPLAILASVALAGAALAAGPAHAAAVHENFTDTFTGDPYDCVASDGTVVHAQDSGTVHVILTVTQRGSGSQHPEPYFTESDHGTVVTTNLDTGRTLTQVFANNFHDLKIIDHGDGTITITQKGSGGTRFYDDTGKVVLRDPGTVRFAVDLDTNGTPGDPSDDIEIPGTFHIVKPSTGNSDFSDRNFCDDLLTYTS
jgi:hypothetical protein